MTPRTVLLRIGDQTIHDLTMPSTPLDPDYEPIEDYGYRAEVVEIARARSEATGYHLNARLEDLCDRFIWGEISEDKFKFEIIHPYLH